MRIEITNPCKEDYSKMIPNESGAFCVRCEKTVRDFTKFSKDKILNFFQKSNSDESICGHFYQDQLNDLNWEEFSKKFNYYPDFKKKLLVVALSMVLFLLPKTNFSQNDDSGSVKGKPKIEVDGGITIDHSENFVLGEYVIDQSKPEFISGKAGLIQFIDTNKNYPKNHSLDKRSGKVIVKFSVSKQGKLSGFKIIQKLGLGYDEEAIRIAKLMPDWIPAQRGNQRVEMEAYIEVEF